MWILATTGFYSIVQKPWDRAKGTLTIRARVRRDLINLKERYLPSLADIIETEDSDYRYRATAPQDEVVQAMAKITADIDYDNFKDAVAARQGYERAAIYHDVWSDLYRLQRIKASGEATNPPFPPVLIPVDPVHGKHSSHTKRGQ